MVSMATYIYTNLYTHTYICISASRSVCSYPHYHRGQDLHACCAKIFPRNSAHRVSNTVSYGRKEIVAYENSLEAPRPETTLKFLQKFRIATFRRIFVKRRTRCSTLTFSYRNLAVNLYHAFLYYNSKRLS